ncbi:hypothetical protein HNQ88_004037 [Aureibacter tunicatorum]|uniref:Uncharacterized protein n=1 Tax=Aureibacter tunicatorum TaxID=866807 RepID=A0AAE3XS93_9BACT|nr:hypothetical protein [Aureibacter tunicatorum]BDD03741.1 hypothetical protein AUTU_12240 [Aureibacter tunicatorum]
MYNKRERERKMTERKGEKKPKKANHDALLVANLPEK